MAREDKLAAAAAENTSVDTGNKGTVAGSEEQQIIVDEQTAVVDEASTAEDTAGAVVEQPAPAAEEAGNGAAPVATAAVSKVRETTDVQVTSTQQSAPRSGSATALTLMAQWDSYIEDAASNKPQTASSVTRLRDRLINLLRTTVNVADNKDFVQVSNYLLKEIVANRTGAFTLSMVHRGFSDMPGAAANKPRFALDAYLCFADPASRAQNIAQYNIVNSAQFADTPELRDRFVAYFNRISGKR